MLQESPTVLQPSLPARHVEMPAGALFSRALAIRFSRSLRGVVESMAG